MGGCVGGEDGGGGLGMVVGEACVFSVERAGLIHGDFFKWALAKCLAWRRHRRTLANGSRPAVVGICACVGKALQQRGGSRYIYLLRDTPSSPVHPQTSSKNTSRG